MRGGILRLMGTDRRAGMMVLLVWLVAACTAGASPTVPLPASDDGPPIWAFVPTPPGGTVGGHSAVTDDRPQHVPGSGRTFMPREVGDLYAAPDWHPDAHPPMPEVVAHGRRPVLFACGYCHLPNGLGRPENASIAGLSEAYIAGQFAAWRAGQRRSSNPPPNPASTMARIAAQATDAELSVAAHYYASLRLKPWIRVVETATVPKTHPSGWMMMPDGSGEEPLGARIIETAEDLQRTELRDDTSGFIAWVPPGSLARGAALASGGAGVPCAACHGAGLQGQADIPPLAGRSPTYLVRQLYDIQHGVRSGPAAAAMQPVVASLSLDDMIALAAWAASLPP